MAGNNIQREAKDIGFGNAQNQRVRFLNKDGTFNVIRRGFSPKVSFNFYHLLLKLSWIRFVILILTWFTLVNLIFTIAYVFVGTEHLEGINMNSLGNQFLDSFFFSAQTFTTVGYGRISPVGIPANIISSLEALIGVMSFAIITGLLYGRFSMPESRLLFSEKAVIAPYRGIKGLMFRIVNLQKSQLLDVEVNVSASMFENKKGERIRSFYSLTLERSTLTFFPTSWTVVHPIDEQSPFYGMNEDQFKDTEVEVLFNFKAFDDLYMQTIHASNSYIISEIEWGAKFTNMLSTEGGWPVVNLDGINDFTKVALPDSDIGGSRASAN